MSETAPVRNEDVIDRDRLAVATACLQGILANPDFGGGVEGITAIATEYADALLAKLSDRQPDAEVNAEATVGDGIAAEFSRNKVYLEPHEQRRLAAMIDAAKPDADLAKVAQAWVDWYDGQMREAAQSDHHFYRVELERVHGQRVVAARAALARITTL